MVLDFLSITRDTITVTPPFLTVLFTRNRYTENIFLGEKSWIVEVVVFTYKGRETAFGARHLVQGDDCSSPIYLHFFPRLRNLKSLYLKIIARTNK